MIGTKPRIHKRLEILDQDQVQAIHDAALKILNRTGVIFEHERALDILGKAGAEIDGRVVRFPERMVRDLIERVPYQIILPALNPELNVHLGIGRIHYTNGYGAPHVRDLETGKVREASLDDLTKFTLLSDFLENVHYVLTQVTVQDIPPEVVDVFQVVELLVNTEKHVGLSISVATYVDEIIQIGRLTSNIGEKEPCRKARFSLGAVSITPLKYTRDGCHRLIRMAEEDVIIRISSLPTAGGTSPVTLAGTLALAHAEVMAGICLVQAVNPGNLIIYGFVGAPMHMAKGKQLTAGPESALMNAAMAQICEYCRLPFGYGSGGFVDSLDTDQQNGLEKAHTTLLAALAGVDTIHHAVGGPLGSGMVACYEDLLISNEFCNIINRELQGIEVTDETLAVNVIEKVGPGGHFLETEHTLSHMRKELLLTKLFDYRSPEERSEGEPSRMLTRAREEVKNILERHQPAYFDPQISSEIRQILESLVKRSGVSVPRLSQ